MQKKHSIAIIITIALLLSISIATVSYAWLGLDQNTIVTHISGKLVTEYFHCGSGTESDPFVITRPIHYYHMVEFFQRLTNLPVVIYSESDQTIVKFGDEYLYFQIGCPEEQLYDPSLRPETDENTEYYVFAYDSFGLLETETYNGHDRGKKSQNLNMAYYSGELSIMPIGSSSVPFVGQLDGKGLTVSNLSIVTTSTVDVHTYDAMGNVTGTTKNVERKTCDVGIFGYIGSSGFPHGADTTDDANLENSAVKNLYFNNVTIDLASLDVSAITSEVSGQEHKNTEDIHNDSVCYAGYIAGHITLSSLVQDVYVNNATFIGGSAASIGFGYFGCVEDTNGAPVTTLGSEVATLRAKGDDAGFGGSIDMKKILTRLQNIWSAPNSAFPANYVSSEVVIIDEVANTVSVPDELKGTSTMTAYTSGSDTYNYHYYTTEKAGKYFYYNRTSMANYVFMCLYGEGTRYPKTRTTYTYKDEFNDAWYIKDGDNYLAVSGTSLTTAGSQADAAKWQFDASGHLYTVIEETNRFSNYYLNRNGTSGLSLTTSANTVWNHTSSQADSFDSYLYTVYNTTNYYIDYNNGWVITPIGTYYYITDGSDHYLSANPNSVANANSENDSVKWEISNPTGATTTVSAVMGGTRYYLRGDGELGVGTSSYTWNRDGDILYTTVQSLRYNLVYESGWKVVPASGKKITDGSGHWLTATTSGTDNATEANAVFWQLSNESGNTQIYTILNGQRYYLTYNNGLTVSTTAATWNRNGNSFYMTSGNKDYYLTYDGSDWNVTMLSYFTINDGAGNYLRVTGANSFANGDSSNATHFYFATEDGANSRGRAYCIVGGETYYLYNNNGTLNTTTTQNTGTEWQNDGNSLYVTSGTTTYAIEYDTDWHIKTIIGGKVITDGNGNYLRITGTGTTDFTNTTDINQATRFTFSNDGENSGTISASINGSTRYLRNNNGTLQTSNQNNATSWSNDGTRLYYGNGNNRRYLGYYNGQWRMTTSNTTTVSSTLYTIGYNGHYLCIDENGAITDTTNVNNATLWSNNTGSIYAVGTDYYLYRNGNTLQTNTGSGTSWDGNNQLYETTSSGGWISQTTYYWITYNNGWTIANGSSWFGAPTMTTLSINAQTETITITSRVEEINTTRPVVKVSSETESAPTLTINNYTASGTALTQIGPLNEQMSFEKTSYQTVTKAVTTERGGYQTYFPIRTAVSGDSDYDANDPYKVSAKNTGYIISAANIEDTTSADNQKLAGDIRISYFPISNISSSYSNTGLTVTRIGYSTTSNNVTTVNYLTLTKDANDEYQISNTTNGDAAVYWQYSGNKLFTTIGKNTYYLTNTNNTLTLSKTSGVNWTYDTNNRRLSNNNYYIQYYNGAWRLRTNTQNLTLDLGTLDLDNIYTYDGTNHVLTNAQKTDVFKQAALQLSESLVGSSSVYGLHFMDSQISTDHLITAEYASVFGQDLYNYEMPEDSIDFHVIEQGTISFFAGEYFTNNNAFFSLHQVFRYEAGDAEVIAGAKKVGDIKMIKEIAEVYKLTDKENYIYRFTDNTYTDADGGYTGSTTPASGYTSAFKTSWITNPSGMASGGTKVYYFEIPCNAGEYCLGSVSGKTGAYLIYLDIATNGGDTIASAISSEGNDVTDSFNVEFRDAPDTVDHTILLFEIEAPAGVTEDEFSVNVTFDKTESAAPHQKGLYTINVVNKSSETLTLYVYLCDDDFNLTTSFQYAYSIVYTNGDNTDTEYVSTYGSTSIQAMAGFSIPPSGSVTEISY